MNLRTTAEDLARWLERRGGQWTVEGEPSLASSLPLPAPGSVLADALRKRAGELVLLAPDTCELAEDARVRDGELGSAVHDVDGLRVFQLAWVAPDGATKDSWLIAESGLVNAGKTPSDGGRSAAAILDILQKGSRATLPRMRKAD